MLYPVTGIEVGNLALFIFDDSFLRLMDMGAYHIVIFFFYCKLGSDRFKIIDHAHGSVYLCHYLFGDRKLFPAECFQDKVNEAVKEDEHFITAASEPGQYFGAALGGIVKYITVEYPGHFIIDLQY